MTFFAVTRVPNARDMSVRKVDINLWVLPAPFRQEYFCDVGVQLELEAPTQSDQIVAFDLTLPFQSSNGALDDLIPTLRSSAKTCNLVFGTNGGSIGTNSNFPTFNDGTSDFLLSSCDLKKSELRSTWAPKANDGRPVSAWRIVAEHLAFPSNFVYLRVRFNIESPGRVWDWQHGIRRNAHAISDIRYNEFRTTSQQQSLPDYANSYFKVDRVNAFIIMSAKYKVGRVSPSPKYVRVLENAAWEKYLGRRLTRRREDFTITYWPQNDVTAEAPLRSFIEVDRRRPTAMKSALFGAATTILAFLLILPPATIANSTIGVVVQQTFLLVAGITLGAAVAAARGLMLVASKWSKLRSFRSWLTRRLYRVR